MDEVTEGEAGDAAVVSCGEVVLLRRSRVLENGLMECWVCKIALKDEAELKKHVFSSLHKENAKTHCIYRRFKEQSPSRKRDDTVFKTPDPRISPRITGKKQVGSITDASSQMVTIKAKSPSPV
eukprot:TRINITY_DN4541_c0_g1_i10.p2 TRINITY_DN4541_c0_g1~~TRINITY_DN4541_c0_g1_i10.p2  ORF type:complete len:124 (-),score=17.81 TRINITY_DN4541_c0_g1_i10:315-686(-)